MKTGKIVRLSAIFWILTFVGQAVAASAVHCNMQLMASLTGSAGDHSQMNHGEMNHAEMGHDMSASNDSDNVALENTVPECCQLGADCSEGNCSYVYLAIEVSQFEFQPIKSRLLTLPDTTPTKFQNSLYRPPISA